MGEENSKRQDQEQPRRFNQEQYDLLKKCSDKKDMAEWNEWREKHPADDVCLDGCDFHGWYLKKANFMKGRVQRAKTEIHFSGDVHLRGANFEWAELQFANFAGAHIEGEGTCFWSSKARNTQFVGTHFEGVDLSVAHLNNSDFSGAFLKNARIISSHINGANFAHADIRGCSARGVIVDGETSLAYCQVNRYSTQQRFTDFNIVDLSSVRIDPGTKQLLEYNIRRKNWEEWYKQHKILKWPVWLFWLMSDYGLSTWRIIAVFVGLVIVFSSIYYVCGMIAPPGIVDYLFVDANGVEVAWWLVPIRAIHFSVVIMTVGFTNMHAYAHSFWAHILVSLQMILGFVLLGALVTRFAVLFTAGGPAGKFADKNKKEDADNGNDEVS